MADSAETVVLRVSTAALKAASVATAVLVGKCVITGFVQAYYRGVVGQRPPEDTKLMNSSLGASAAATQSFRGETKAKDPSKQEAHDASLMALERVNRIQHNDFENVPLGLVVIWAGVLASSMPGLHAKLSLAFAAGRVLHSVSFALKIGLLRSIGFMVGLWSMVAMIYGLLA